MDGHSEVAPALAGLGLSIGAGSSEEFSKGTKRRPTDAKPQLVVLPESNVAISPAAAEGATAGTAAVCHGDDWWPELRILPEVPPAGVHEDDSSADMLDAACTEHLRAIVYRCVSTAPRRWHAKRPLEADDESDNEKGRELSADKLTERRTTELDIIYADSIVEVVLQALSSVSDPSVLAGLQRTACMQWKAEAQIRATTSAALTAVTAAQASASSSSSAAGKAGAVPQGEGAGNVGAAGQAASRWGKLGWPAAALRGFISASGSSAASRGDGTLDIMEPFASSSYDSATAPSYKLSSKEERVRKRDVALAMLGNALWLAAQQSGAQQEPSQGRDGGAPATSPISRRGSVPPATPVAKPKAAGHHGGPAHKRGALPTFIAPSTPTTALSAAASPTIPPQRSEGIMVSGSQKEPSSMVRPPLSSANSAASLVELAKPPITPLDLSRAASPAPDAAPSTAMSSEASSSSSPLPGSPSTAAPEALTEVKPSKAMERLASLNAAAGAALQARAAAAAAATASAAEGSGDANIASEKVEAATGSVATLSPEEAAEAAARQAAAAVETAALEQAEREFIARVGKDCEQRAKMVLAVFMFRDDRYPAGGDKSDGMGPTTDAAGGDPSSSRYGSVLSSKSDRTIGANGGSGSRSHTLTARGRGPSTLRSDGGVVPRSRFAAVQWLPGVYEGRDLYAARNDGGEIARKADLSPMEFERIKREGGTFAITHSQDEAEAELLRATLGVALYAAASMLLETAFLRDLGYRRPEPVKTEETEAKPEDDAGPKDADTNGDDEAEKQDRTNKEDDATATGVNEDRSRPSSGKRWAKGIWGMLQSGSDVVSAALGPSRARHQPHGLQRTSTADPSSGKEQGPSAKAGSSGASFGSFSRSFTFEDDSAGGGKSRSVSRPQDVSLDTTGKRIPSNRLGRLINSVTPLPHRRHEAKEARRASSRRSDRASLDATHGIPAGRASIEVGMLKQITDETARQDLAATEELDGVCPPALTGPLWSTSPEISALLRDRSSTIASDASIVPRGMPFIERFMHLQSLTVLMSGREAQAMGMAAPAVSSPLPMVKTPTMTSGSSSYFGSVSSTSSAALLPSASAPSSRSVSGSSLVDMANEPALSVPSTPLMGPPKTGAKGRPLGNASGGPAMLHNMPLSARCTSRREETSFYRRTNPGRDIHLGHIVEDLCSRAEAAVTAPTAAPRTVHYLHGRNQVIIAAHAPHPAMQHQVDGSSHGPTAGSGVAAEDVAHNEDVAAVASAMHADRNAAQTAVAFADEAIRAAETDPSTAAETTSTAGPTSTSVPNRTTSDPARAILMWTANIQTGELSEVHHMAHQTWMLSFAKYLEALMYHPAILHHGSADPALSVGYGARYDIAQLFQRGKALVKVSVKPLVVYDLKIEGPTITKDGPSSSWRQKTAEVEYTERRHDCAVESTRIEVQRFYASVKVHIADLETVLRQREPSDADPAAADQNKIGCSTEDEDEELTKEEDNEDDLASLVDAEAVSGDATPSAPTSTSDAPSDSPLRLLRRLRAALRVDEYRLYDIISATERGDVNTARKELKEQCGSAQTRLAAWSTKHLIAEERAALPDPLYEHPPYLDGKHHVMPGSRYVVREDEPLSIIAWSLGSLGYRKEVTGPQRGHPGQGARRDVSDASAASFASDKLADVLDWRATVVDRSGQSTGHALAGQDNASLVGPSSRVLSSSARSTVSSSSTTFDRASSYQPLKRGASAIPAADPDAESWFVEPDPVNAVIKRKKRGREASILALTLRRVGSGVSAAQTESMRGFPDLDGGGEDDLTASRYGTAGRLTTSGLDPQSLDFAPPVQNATLRRRQQQQAGTISSSIEAQDSFRAHVTQVSGRPGSLASLFSRETSAGTAASASSTAASTSAASSVGTASTAGGGAGSMLSAAGSVTGSLESASTAGAESKRTPVQRQGEATPRKASVASSAAMPSASTAAGTSVSGTEGGGQHPAGATAESPHIKHTLYHGNTKISCVSWFAEQFAALRERWGVEDDFVESLSSSQPWSAVGGKSKSNFFKTSDERWIGKQLLTVWSVDELDGLLEFAPAYIRYMLNSHANDCPSLLVKMGGFYSLKVKDVKSGETKFKMSVMIIENLFADVDVQQVQRFDLKGIKDRRAARPQPTAAAAAATAAATGESRAFEAGSTQQRDQAGAQAAKVSSAQGNADGPATASYTQLGAHGSSSTTVSSSSAAASASGSKSTTTATPATERQSSDRPLPQTAQTGNVPSSGSQQPATVYWDADWMEMYQGKAFVPEQQKLAFTRALRNDLAFLTESNVMDFSLLVGVTETTPRVGGGLGPDDAAIPAQGQQDDDGLEDQGHGRDANDGPPQARVPFSSTAFGTTDNKPSMRVRIVDYISAFTFAKQLESSSKKALKSSAEARGNVTVLPPGEYAARFESAMLSYFTGVPEGWDERARWEMGAEQELQSPRAQVSTNVDPRDDGTAGRGPTTTTTTTTSARAKARRPPDSIGLRSGGVPSVF